MKNLRFFLFGLVLTQFTIFAQEATPKAVEDAQTESIASEATQIIEEIATSSDETEKWQFIEKYFAADLNILKIHQKLGRFLDNYSSYMAACVTPWSALVAVGIFDKIEKKININIKNNRAWDLFELTNCCCIAPIIGFLITNKILKAIGEKLENEDERCLQLLTDFLNNWEKNKAQTPASLIPMFEKLATDNNISKGDKAFAQKIVETIIATSLMINSVK